MELDIQKFMQSTDQYQFEFQHFPTSYLRCAAHRVAQHYGLQTVALDYTTDGLGSRIVARKTPESNFTAICLSDIPTKQQTENNKIERVKIAIRPRRNNFSMVDSGQQGNKRNSVRTVEEREEEYDKARARIFSGSSKPVVGPSSTSVVDRKSSVCSSTGVQESYMTLNDNTEKISLKDIASRVAIFRDREKDMTDPDYDRSYNRYVKGVAPSHRFSFAPCNFLQSSPLQFQEGISHLGQLPGAQPLVSCRLLDPAMSTFYAVACKQAPLDAVYMQLPNPAVMYAQTYEPLRGSSVSTALELRALAELLEVRGGTVYPNFVVLENYCKTLSNIIARLFSAFRFYAFTHGQCRWTGILTILLGVTVNIV